MTQAILNIDAVAPLSPIRTFLQRMSISMAPDRLVSDSTEKLN